METSKLPRQKIRAVFIDKDKGWSNITSATIEEERRHSMPKTGLTGFGYPKWWHHHGTKLLAASLDLEKAELTLAASAAKVVIRPAPGVKGQNWLVSWEVIQSRPSGIKAEGTAWFELDELAAAFCLAKEVQKTTAFLKEEYCLDSGRQGSYILFRNYLNIPCPGTGHDGDPNVSILVDDEIKQAVRNLLAAAGVRQDENGFFQVNRT